MDCGVRSPFPRLVANKEHTHARIHTPSSALASPQSGSSVDRVWETYPTSQSGERCIGDTPALCATLCLCA